jgi:hypothetical protein
MYTYLVSGSGNGINWASIGDEPFLTDVYYPGLLYSSVLMHEKEFTAQEFSEMCESCVKKYMSGMVEHSLHRLGVVLLQKGHTFSQYRIEKNTIIAAIYLGLIDDFGFIPMEKSTSYVVRNSVAVNLDPDIKLKRNVSGSLGSKVKEWFKEAMQKRKEQI